MLTKTLGIAVLLGAAGAFVLGIDSPPSVAGAIFGKAPVVLMERDTNIEPAAVAKKKVVVKRKKTKHGVVTTRRTTWVYNSKRHGHRYNYRSGPNVYYYGGYYYERPWWTLAAPSVNLCFGC